MGERWLRPRQRRLLLHRSADLLRTLTNSHVSLALVCPLQTNLLRLQVCFPYSIFGRMRKLGRICTGCCIWEGNKKAESQRQRMEAKLHAHHLQNGGASLPTLHSSSNF